MTCWKCRMMPLIIQEPIFLFSGSQEKLQKQIHVIFVHFTILQNINIHELVLCHTKFSFSMFYFQCLLLVTYCNWNIWLGFISFESTFQLEMRTVKDKLESDKLINQNHSKRTGD